MEDWGITQERVGVGCGQRLTLLDHILVGRKQWKSAMVPAFGAPPWLGVYILRGQVQMGVCVQEGRGG